MPINEPVFLHHAWLMFVAVTVANAVILKFRSMAYIRQRPELADGYRRLFWGILLLGNLPWLVMGFGLEVGGVPGMFSYIRPRDGNPFVLTFIASVGMLWILGFYWIFARRGAEFLIDHPGLFRGNPQSPAMIRVFYCLAIAGGMIALIFMAAPDFVPMAR